MIEFFFHDVFILAFHDIFYRVFYFCECVIVFNKIVYNVKVSGLWPIFDVLIELIIKPLA